MKREPSYHNLPALSPYKAKARDREAEAGVKERRGETDMREPNKALFRTGAFLIIALFTVQLLENVLPFWVSGLLGGLLYICAYDGWKEEK